VTVASVYDAVRRHYSDFWAGRKHKDFEWTAGPMAGRFRSFGYVE
jgi:hypothetical protein